jgi:TolB-like protein
MAAQPPDSFLARIKRHKVVEWTLAYVAFGYALLHGVQMLRETFEWPLLIPRLTVVGLVLGAPIAVTLAWYHGHRARHRVSGQELSILIALLVVAGSVLWWASRSGSSHAAPTVATDSTHHAKPLGEKSIAVLPFVDLSEKHDQEYFADGMAEEVLNQLAKVPGLKVIGRTSSFQFKGKADDLRNVGEVLGAAFILEGSVRKASDRIRVTAQLINAADGAHRWSETYERSMTDVLTIQTEIAMSIGRALQLEVADLPTTDSKLSPSRREAYDIYLRGEHAGDRGDQRGFEEAAVRFRSALQRDPTFADAAEALSSTLEALVEWHFVEPRSGSQQVREAALLALRLNPRSAGARGVLGGNITVYDWDWPRAEEELNAALALSAKDSDVATFAAMYSVAVGKWDRALQLLDTAISDDPLNPSLLNAQSMTLARLGRWSEAEDVARRILEISSTSSWNRYWLSVVLLMQGKSEDALREAKQETATMYRLAAIGMACDALGWHAESDAALRELEASQLLGRDMRIAEIYAVRGDLTEAMEWLEKAYDAKDASLYYVKGHPPFRNLLGDPRYKAFLRKMNLPE